MLGAEDVIVKKIHGSRFYEPYGLMEETEITEMLTSMK